MLSEFVADFFTTFLDPRKRVFIGYLASALLIALLWLLFYERRSLKKSLRYLVSPSLWWSDSSRLDYGVFIVNKLVMSLIAPRLLTQLALASAIFYGFYNLLDERPILLSALPDAVIMAGFTVVYFLLDDFSRFYVHRLMHRISWLWAFHRVHHSATVLTPITIFRTHPVEGVIFTLRTACVQGLTIGSFVFFLGDRVDLVTVLGANIFSFLFNVLGSNLRHSPIAIYYPRSLEKLFLSPAQHQIHHSTAPEHFDKNFGVVLAVWDRMFGSFHQSERERVLNYGLGEAVQPQHTLFNAYIEPFKFSASALSNSCKSLLCRCAGFHKKWQRKNWNFNFLR